MCLRAKDDCLKGVYFAVVGKRQSIATEQDKWLGLIALFHQAILTDLVSPSCSLSILR